MSPKHNRTFHSRTLCRLKNIFMWVLRLSVRGSNVTAWQKILTPSIFALWVGRFRFHPEDYFHVGYDIVWLTSNLPPSEKPATSIFNFVDKDTSFHRECCCHMGFCAVWLNRCLLTSGNLILKSSGWYRYISHHWNVCKFLSNLPEGSILPRPATENRLSHMKVAILYKIIWIQRNVTMPHSNILTSYNEAKWNSIIVIQ
jgi:hypothetical protein